MGSPRERRDPCLPSFLPLQESQLPALPVPVHPRGAVRGGPHRGAPRAQCGTGGDMQRKVSAPSLSAASPCVFFFPPVFKLGQRSTGSLRAGTWNFLTCCPPSHVENEMGAGNPCRSLIVIWKRRNQIPRIREHWGVLHGGNWSRDVNDLESSF